MANIKNLFNNTISRKVLASSSLNTVGSPIESADYVVQNFEEQNRFIPHVDFASSSNFAFYGSAKKYYEDAFTYIANEYPYDGSLKEKIDWELSGTYFDKHVFDNVYPRTTGYINHGLDYSITTGFTLSSSYQRSSKVENILVRGGPHTGSSNVSSDLSKNFSGSNVYKQDVNQQSNLELNLTGGVCVEFWLKKESYSSGSESQRQTIFDLWNNEYNDAYGRLRIDWDNGSKRFAIEIASGSQGISTGASKVVGQDLTSSIASWNHYAFNFQKKQINFSQVQISVDLYKNGIYNDTLTDVISLSTPFNEVTGAMAATIGALIVGPNDGGGFVDGAVSYAKLSASLDEFRFWKTKRTPEQIARNWFTQIAGGTNTDYSTIGTGSAKYSPGKPVDLGVYYKFNEGINDSGSADSSDAVVLDYSGRLSNGAWTGYTLGARTTGSAMIESSASLSEFKDPILNLSHPLVSSSLNSYRSSGEIYDSTNNSSIFHTLPSWIVTGKHSR